MYAPGEPFRALLLSSTALPAADAGLYARFRPLHSDLRDAQAARGVSLRALARASCVPFCISKRAQLSISYHVSGRSVKASLHHLLARAVRARVSRYALRERAAFLAVPALDLTI